MANHEQVGTLARFSARELADRAAARIVDATEPLAVCICPRGIVTVEPYDDAVFEDVVGNFAPGSLDALRAQVFEALEHTIAERGIVADTSHRRRGGAWETYGRRAA